jgi:hypothetical protein
VADWFSVQQLALFLQLHLQLNNNIVSLKGKNLAVSIDGNFLNFQVLID